jgi:hypothetical protein
MRTASRKRAAKALLMMKLLGVILGAGTPAVRAAAAEDGDKTNANPVPAAEAAKMIKVASFDEALDTALSRRGILARHGWFRTARNDHPHFTYLGLREERLPSHGLKKLTTAGGEF